MHGRNIFIDRLQLLIGLAEAGENLLPWLERFRGDAPKIRAACDFISARNPGFAAALLKIRDLMDIGPLFKTTA